MTVMKAFSFGLRSAIFARHSSVSFSDVTCRRHAGATSLIVVIIATTLSGIVLVF